MCVCVCDHCVEADGCWLLLVKLGLVVVVVAGGEDDTACRNRTSNEPVRQPRFETIARHRQCRLAAFIMESYYRARRLGTTLHQLALALEQ